MREEHNENLYLAGDQFCSIIEIMEKQLETRSGLGKQNLEINFNSISEKNGEKITQEDLYGIIEVLLFEINK